MFGNDFQMMHMINKCSNWCLYRVVEKPKNGVLCVGYASLSFPVSEWKEVDSSTGGFSRIGSTASFTESTGSTPGFRTKIG